MTPEARARLRGLINREIESPGDPQRFREALEEAFPDLEWAMRLASLKDEEHRTTFYVKSEHVWYRRFGFRMMRPLFVVAIIAAVLFSLQRVIDPAIALACFLGGAFAFYFVLQIYAYRWSRKDLGKLDDARSRYRQRLERLRDELDDAGGG